VKDNENKKPTKTALFILLISLAVFSNIVLPPLARQCETRGARQDIAMFRMINGWQRYYEFVDGISIRHGARVYMFTRNENHETFDDIKAALNPFPRKGVHSSGFSGNAMLDSRSFVSLIRISYYIESAELFYIDIGAMPEYNGHFVSDFFLRDHVFYIENQRHIVVLDKSGWFGSPVEIEWILCATP